MFGNQCEYCKLRHTHKSNCPEHDNNRGKKMEGNMESKTKSTPENAVVSSQQIQYDKAAELVKKVNERTTQLFAYKVELGNLLTEFKDVTFKKFPNTEVTGMIFSGVTHKGKLLVGASKCQKGDEFSELIGKLIAVRRALNKDTKDIYEFLDKNQDIKGIK
jgi:hypothetical protein